MNDKVQRLYEYIMAKNYGDIIYHQEIAEQIGERMNTPRYFSTITAAKKALLEAGRMIKSVRRSGYQVVDPDDYTVHAVRQVVTAGKKIDNGVKIMRHAPVSNMTPDGVESYNRVNDRLQILQASVTGAKVELKMLGARRPHPLRQLGQGAAV